jgi:hypothetical protein
MRRIHFIEIEDQIWCPKALRDGVTDFIQHIVGVYGLYKPIVPRLADALFHSKQIAVVDLCSGGAGPWLSILEDLQKAKHNSITLTLTDLYPNLRTFRAIQAHAPQNISFCDQPVNATQVPKNLTGFRTLFSSFHHLKPEQAQAVLQNAVNAKTGIAAFESTQRHPLLLLYMLITPLLVWLNTPFIRPFRWSRLFLTYIIPLIPLIVMFDGFVSCLRTYTVEELQIMTKQLNAPDYHWEIGIEHIGFLPIGVTYLIGYPAKTD